MPARKRRTSSKGSRSKRGRKRAESTAGSTRPRELPEFALRDDAVERALRTGEQQGLLEDYFGSDNYAELRQLSKDVAARGRRGGPKVLILPGIMGSTIGRRGSVGLFDDVYWFDPIDIAAGRLTDLALTGTASKFSALGVILFAYLKLKLRLQAAGYDAEFYPFDWRMSIAELGKQLARRLDNERGNVDLVAHSMGGLVARSALAQGGNCRRLVMLGTPNFGSFAPVMALRAIYPLVRKVGALDLRHSPEELARDVFSSFPGLTEMLPAPASLHVDLYDVDQWPNDDLRPRPDILARAKHMQDGLAPGRNNFFLVAGVDQRTVTGVTREQGQFLYAFSTAGDGTVPLELARLPNIAGTYYVAESHGSLPNNATVARAVIDLLATGATKALATEYAPATRAAAVDAVPEARLRDQPYDGRRGELLSQRELRSMLSDVAAPDAHDRLPPTIASEPTLVSAGAAQPDDRGFSHVFNNVVVGRRYQHRLELRFAFGSITEVDARAIALGVFRGVTPVGAARAVDLQLNGALTELYQRRMFDGQVGEIFNMPTGRHDIRTDLITFVGLGDFDRFNVDVLQSAAENVIRTFVNSRVEEFATVVFGGGSGEHPAIALRNLMLGFFRGLKDADQDHQFRRIIICENNPASYELLKQELYRLSSTALCDGIELTFDEKQLPPPREVAPRRAQASAEQPAVYLIVRKEEASGARPQVRSSLLTAGGKATVVSGTSELAVADFESLREDAVSDRIRDFNTVGPALGKLLLADEVRTVLPRFRDHHLVVVHDGAMSRVPWEVVALEDSDAGKIWFPAAECGLSHRYAADHLSVAKWLEARVRAETLQMLLVVNPTEDLDGAEAEGDRIRQLVQTQGSIRLAELQHQEATRPALLAAFSSGRYDVIHYAGHASFNETSPELSGIYCSGGAVLSGADLAGLGSLPSLVFFNACEAARIRARPRKQSASVQARRSRERLARVTRGVAFAEAFMRGGVANFIGTYWPVNDDAAMKFAQSFYTGILAGKRIGAAIQDGRGAIGPRNKDWANYTFYGDANFVLKQGGESTPPSDRPTSNG